MPTAPAVIIHGSARPPKSVTKGASRSSMDIHDQPLARLNSAQTSDCTSIFWQLRPESSQWRCNPRSAVRN
jgi:hypothetical protein